MLNIVDGKMALGRCEYSDRYHLYIYLWLLKKVTKKQTSNNMTFNCADLTCWCVGILVLFACSIRILQWGTRSTNPSRYSL